jgi:uncharacterized protein DUF6602
MRCAVMTAPEISPRALIQAAARQLREEFAAIQATNPHSGESGAEAETILKKFLKDRVPRRFDVESGVVIGTAGVVSRQTDLIVYDALNSPVYRNGPRLYIIPRDNVAAVVEVKSKLSKEELRDAAVKIASVKQMRPSPISDIDQPVTFSTMIMANTLGCVFAYDSYTSLDALADNLREINEQHDSREWIDLVTVMGKGTLAYAVQLPLSETFPAWFGGPTEESFPVPPFYVHLVKHDDSDLALNHFFLKLMSHLAFFRKRTTLDFQGVLGSEQTQIVTIQGYQYNLGRRLVPVEPAHQTGTFRNPHIRFNIYSQSDRSLLGQVGYLSWQDGAVLTCSVKFDHRLIFEHYFRSLRQRGLFLQAGSGYNLWFSSVLPVSEAAFIEASQQIHPELIVVRDSDDDNPPAVTLPNTTE